MSEVFPQLEQHRIERCMLLSDADSGLRAVLVFDDITMGPAAGGVRTKAYKNFEHAIREAHELAKAMTSKCALADLGAGGGSIVVLEHDGLQREAAFEALGAHIETLEGLFRAAGDYGTTQDDLRAMARRTRYVQSDEERLSKAVAYGVLRSIEALQRFRGKPARVEGLLVSVQGCGAIGAAVAEGLAEQGAKLVVSDLVETRAERVARSTGAKVVPPEDILQVEADIFAPCAHGDWLSPELVDELAARAVCGAATNLLTGLEAARRLQANNILHVPDAVTSAGAAVEDIGRTMMGLPDRTPLLDHLGQTALTVLKNARDRGITPFEAAESLAQARLQAARERS